MNHPDLYHKAHDAQRHDSEEFFLEYFPKMQWRFDGNDTLIDIGSGCGNVLIDIVYPRMPKNIQRFVASDINPKMISYAQHCYGHLPKVEFKVLDIASKKLPRELKHKFDHVTSFYTLMWVNQRQAVKNIYNLLRPEGGDCLLVFLSSHPMYEVYKLMSDRDKWSQYMYDKERFISPLQNVKEPDQKFATFMREAGFSQFEVKLLHKHFVYESFEVFRTDMKAVNPFLDRVPVALHEEFMDDIMLEIIKQVGLTAHQVDLKAQFTVPYANKIFVTPSICLSSRLLRKITLTRVNRLF
ncbi:juvenile hormone acid O-methyltransferase-like [Musca autumnalis]|uniref:juvenile hormone acid O-methyltransferase-like n=1 Tax=Musca autumnalis TaxID=221902 RepID=UPI003CEA63EE